ncbi:uncharacterized protein LOC141532363 [Cotesia typhae]|uniref:uncharacterized protein LOC141532363 n=1 Tax=Cotesia typhae TaxID=2053667 RepID=UPI003D69B7FE
MTSRLNQDQLENFFGIMRSVCRCSDHPDTILFGQVFRLLCSYSLVTPPKGSNVTAGELLQSLMQSEDSLATANALKKNWLNEIDAIVENGISSNYSSSDDNNNIFSHPNTSVAKKPFESLLDEDSDDDNDDTMPSFIRKPFESLLDEDSEDDIEDDDDLYHDNHYPFENLTEVDDSSTENNINDHNQNKINIDSNENFLQSENDWEGSNSFRDDQHYHHDYDVVSTSDGIVAYIAGYVARKFQRMTSCCECIETLRSANSSERDRVIELMSNGGLIFPSENLFRLIKNWNK